MSPEKEPEDTPTTGVAAVAAGFAIMAEATLAMLVSIPLLLFGGIGILGIAGGAGLFWAGWLLAGLSEGNLKLASVVTMIAGGAVTLVILTVVVMTSCASIVNCGPTQSYSAFLLPVAAGVFNIACAAVLWRRASTP